MNNWFFLKLLFESLYNFVYGRYFNLFELFFEIRFSNFV